MNAVPATDNAHKEPFDLVALEDYLRQHITGFSGPVTATRFKGGQSNPTYLLTTPTRQYVMRAKPGPVAQLLPSAHAVEREFAVMRGLYGTAVPVPQMHVLCEDESVIGRAFYIMEYLQGRVLWDQALPGMAMAERAAIYDEMNRVIAALHSVPFAERGLAGYGKPGNYFERQIGRWSKQYKASVTQPIPEMDRLMPWLAANIPASARDEGCVSIVHGDYRLDNLMFHPADPRVIACLDGELSTLGHPLADFSYHGMAWNIPAGLFRGIGGLDLVSLGIPSEAEYVRWYGEATGRDAAGHRDYYIAYNLFRMAAILHGVAQRAADGNANAEDAFETGAKAAPLAELGWDRAQRYAAKRK